MKVRVIEAFQERFGKSPSLVVRAPGRVNLIGEHTDYNDGFVLPMAIERAVWLAVAPREDERVLAYSLEQSGAADFDAARPAHADEGWAEYVKAMAKMLLDAGHPLKGWDGVLTSDVPIGSGLSSSAALEMAVGFAFSAVSGFPWDGVEMARLGQRAENDWVGAETGIMDQLISANGKAGSGLLIDCRDLAMTTIPLPRETAVVIMDTMTRHSHKSSGYNERRKSCETAANRLGVTHLRDLDMNQLDARASELDDVRFRRARHVVSENDRVLAAARAMQAGEADRMGRLMSESHASLRDDFEVTNPELDAMAEIARSQPGCFGARMTGGGFGGCAVALVARERAEGFAATVHAEYEAATGLSPRIFATVATDGTAIA